MTVPAESRSGTPYEMVVELGKVREFARATKSTNPDYLSADNPVAPVTFLVTSTFWQVPDSDVGLGITSYERVLHGAQEYVFFGEPPRVGAVLHVQAKRGEVYEKSGRRGGVMKFHELITEYRDQSGELVAEGRGTIIETSQAPTESADA